MGREELKATKASLFTFNRPWPSSLERQELFGCALTGLDDGGLTVRELLTLALRILSSISAFRLSRE